MSYLNNCLKQKLDVNIRNMIEKSLKVSNLLLFLISDILDYSQIMNNKLRINPVEFSIKTMLNEVFDIY
jgi:signal transduction histidine kinase